LLFATSISDVIHPVRLAASFTVVSDTLPIRTARDLLSVFADSNFSCLSNLLRPICQLSLVLTLLMQQLIGTIVSYSCVPKVIAESSFRL
jgi:hypothetical protein